MRTVISSWGCRVRPRSGLVARPDEVDGSWWTDRTHRTGRIQPLPWPRLTGGGLLGLGTPGSRTPWPLARPCRSRCDRSSHRSGRMRTCLSPSSWEAGPTHRSWTMPSRPSGHSPSRWRFGSSPPIGHRMTPSPSARGAADAGIKVIIAAAGGAAHLAGVAAAATPLPVIGVPVALANLGGLDSLLAMVQMPKGIPVATVAVNGARNAALLAVQDSGAERHPARRRTGPVRPGSRRSGPRSGRRDRRPLPGGLTGVGRPRGAGSAPVHFPADHGGARPFRTASRGWSSGMTAITGMSIPWAT